MDDVTKGQVNEIASLSKPQRLPDQPIHQEDGGKAMGNSVNLLENYPARVMSEEHLQINKEERFLGKISKKSLNQDLEEINEQRGRTVDGRGAAARKPPHSKAKYSSNHLTTHY